jgi:hypothetical protein
LILVFASELDDNARDAVTNWSKQKAVLLTPADFFCNGWFVTAETLDNWSIVAAGKWYPVSAISGVVTLISRIFARELFDVEPEERSYAAAEASAFALFLLSKLPCPVVNRPTPDCLTGPNWRPEQWAHACFKAGIRTKRSKRTNHAPPQAVPTPRLTSVTVLAGKCLEDTSEGCLSGVLTLARLADVAFLRCYFTLENGQSFFDRAEVIPDLSKADTRDALSEYFCAFNS